MMKFVMLLLFVTPDGVTHGHSFTREFKDKEACVAFGESVFETETMKSKNLQSHLTICSQPKKPLQWKYPKKDIEV